MINETFHNLLRNRLWSDLIDNKKYNKRKYI